MIVKARPDPSLDREVTGLIAAQDAAARRFANAQIGNFNRRMESLHNGGGAGGFSNQLGLTGGRTERIDGLEALDRYRRYIAMDDGGHPNDAQNGMMESLDGGVGGPLGYGPGAGGGSGSGAGGEPRRWGVWAAGSADFGMRDAVSGQSGFRFSTDGLTAGADYRVNEQLAVGLGFGYGRDSSRIGDIGTHSRADSYSGGLYASFLPVPGAFIDGVVGLGTLSFESRRTITASGDIARGDRDGDQMFASITAGIERRGDQWLLSPYGRVGITRSKLDRFTETGGGAYGLTFDEHTVRTLTGAVGLRGNYVYLVGRNAISPHFRVEYTHDFEGADDAMLSYADWIGGPSYRVAVSPIDRDLARLELGVDFRLENGWSFGVDLDGSLGSNSDSHGVRLSLQSTF